MMDTGGGLIFAALAGPAVAFQGTVANILPGRAAQIFSVSLLPSSLFARVKLEIIKYRIQ